MEEPITKTATLIVLTLLLTSSFESVLSFSVLTTSIAHCATFTSPSEDDDLRAKRALGIIPQRQSASVTPPEAQVVALVNGTRAYDYALAIEDIGLSHTVSNYSFRAAGSSGANETAKYVMKQFQSFGLETDNESFQFTNWDLSTQPTLIIDEDGNPATTDDQVHIHSFQSTHYSWPTPQDGVFRDLVVLPLPPAANMEEIGLNPIDMNAWNAIDTTNKILLIGQEVRWSSAWHETYRDKLYAQPPASIVLTWWYEWMSFTPIVYSSAGGRPVSTWGSYYWNLQIPVGGVDYYEGSWIRNRENSVNVSASFKIESIIGYGPHYNVIGKLTGYTEPDKFVIVSGHYDSVTTPGFGDNGAGTAGVIELARVLTDAVKNGLYHPKYSILFIAFASEEVGLVGSIYYIKQHKAEMTDIVAVLNLDCIGSDYFHVSETNPADGLDLDQLVLQAAADLGVNAALTEPGGSDQEAFRNPSWANGLLQFWWGINPGIGDATPVEPSALLISYPLLYSEQWSTGTPGWIHTSYDNSTSTQTLNWIEIDDLEDHIKIATLSILRVSPPVTVHDIVVINVTCSKTVVGQDYSVSINVTVANQGDFSETFDVNVYYDSTLIDTQESVFLDVGANTTLEFTWDTTGVAKGNYAISAYATPVPGETITDDNTHIDGTLLVTIPGDVNGDRIVNIFDAGTISAHWYPGPPIGPLDYDANADINSDGAVDIIDVGIVNAHWGQSW